jgi:hypothetical protein
MRRSITTFIIIFGGILTLLLSGCYQPGGPVPETKHNPPPRDWTMVDVDEMVDMTMEKIYSPAPRDNGAPPALCDWIHYYRFRCSDGSPDPNQADAIIVLIPGFLGGANSLECISRQMVYMARKQRGKHIEVWTIDRRPNNIEDLTGLEAAEKAHDTNLAIDYYYNGAEINGRVFKGFLTDQKVPYLSEFGLELSMRDIYTVITVNVPDPAVRRKKVFVGGHSLGGPYTAYFAGWDFDGNPATLEDAGYMNCAGLIGLDTMIMPSIPFMDQYLEEILGSYGMNDDPKSWGEELYLAALVNMRLGYMSRMVTPLTVIAAPEVMAVQELLAMEAAWNPDQESTLLDRLPYSYNISSMFQTLHSKDLAHFLFHIPSIRDFRFTNEALLGITVDDNYQPLTALQCSMGFLSGGAVVEKQFPLPQDWASLPQLSILKSAFNMDGQFIANDAGPSCLSLGAGPLYTWANFDEIGDASDPDYTDEGGSITYTTTGEEVSDIQDVARFMYMGPTNSLEWYFPIRPLLDMAVVGSQADFGPKYGLTFFHGDKVAGMPQIDFVAGKGPLLWMTENLPPEINVVEGYNHLDVCTAAPDRSSLRPNEVIDPILDFILADI